MAAGAGVIGGSAYGYGSSLASYSVYHRCLSVMSWSLENATVEPQVPEVQVVSPPSPLPPPLPPLR